MNHSDRYYSKVQRAASEWSFPGTLTMPYALRVCVQSRGWVDIPRRWHPKRMKPTQGMVQQRHRRSILVQPFKEHLETQMTLPFQTRISPISTRQTTTDSQWVMNPVQRAVNSVIAQEKGRFLVEEEGYLHEDLQRTDYNQIFSKDEQGHSRTFKDK